MKKIFITFLLAVVLISSKSIAQTNEFLEGQQYRNGHISFATIKKEKSATAFAQKETIIKDVVGNTSGITFTKTVADIPLKSKNRIRQEKYQLYKNGIKMRGAEYIITFVNDSMSSVHGFFAPVSNDAFKTQYNAQISSGLAVKQFNTSHKVRGLEDKSQGKAGMNTAVYYFDYAANQYRAAYQVQVTSMNEAYSENIFISASTGQFLGSESLVCGVNFPGTAQTQYSGVRNITTDAPTAAGPFRLQETRSANNVLIRTRNMNGLADLSFVTEFTDNDNNWTMAEHGNDLAALDAHWGAEMVYDYWLAVHNRNSINGSGMAIESYVHLGTNVSGARWFQNSMQYEDGFFGFDPFTTLDVCAHEFGHGVDQFTGNLAYERESGALDEGFADIWGASVEAWADPNKNRWLLGEELFIGPIRNMANPNAFGQPDTYLGTNWVNTVGCTPTNANDACGVHTNSGVLNFWFFLLSEGGIGTNDLTNNYAVTGQGITTAADIAYATKLLLNNSLADYPLCRNVSIQAAINLYGANSCQVAAVTNAWFAVGVGAAYNGSLGLTVSGPGIPCLGTTTTYSVSQNLPPNSVTWSITPANASITITPNGNSVDLTTSGAQSSTNYMLQAVVATACGNAIVQKYFTMPATAFFGEVHTGGYVNQLYEEDNYIYSSAGVNIFSNYPNVGSYDWQPSDGNTAWYSSSSNGDLGFFIPNLNDSRAFSCTFTDDCGQHYHNFVFWNLGYNGKYALKVSPNPATSIVKVAVVNAETNKAITKDDRIDITKLKIVKLYDKMGNCVSTQSVNIRGNEFYIDVSNLKPDIYTIVTNDGKMIANGKIIKQ